MANIIAIVWDFDKTLIDGYMEDPIFKEYGVDPKAFWAEVNALPQKYMEQQHVRVNADTIYLNHMINYVKNGTFKGLNNEKLREFGKRLKYYPGVPRIFKITKELVENNPRYSEYDIKVEHYIVSTGIAEIIRGSSVMEYVRQIWGCEFIDSETPDGSKEISEICYTIDNTTKTRAIFEINKGVGIEDDITVNTKIPEEDRRVHMINMVYVADGPSDIPAFSVVNQRGGATFAVYPKGDKRAMKQVEKMRQAQRINMFAEADYSEDSTACMWLCNKVEEFAERIRRDEKSRLKKYTAAGEVHHLVE